MSDSENWAASETVRKLLTGPYEAEQDEGEVTLYFQQGDEAVSAVFNAGGVILVLSPSTPGFRPLRASWADIIKAAK